MEQNQYKYQDIQRLIYKLKTGTLSNHERSELEKYALVDPFLKEAIEGYSRFAELDHDSTLERIKKKVRSKSEKREIKRTPLYLRIAAAIALLVCATWILRELIVNENDKIIASATKEKDKYSDLTLPEITHKSFSNENYKADEEAGKIIPDLKAQESVTGNKHSYRTNAGDKKSVDTQPTEASNFTQLSELASLDDLDTSDLTNEYSKGHTPFLAQNQAEEITSKEVLAEVSDAATKDEVVKLKEFDSTKQTVSKHSFDSLLSFANAMPQGDLLYTIKGAVIDQRGNPLIGASIIETGTKNAVVTDVVGRFSIILEKLDNPLKVSFKGYQESKIPSSQRGKYIEVIMFENEATMDEVAAEQTTKRAQKSVTSYDFILAKPVIGFKKFQKYIEQNAKYPDGYTSDNINGTVQVMFLLDDQGKPHTIEVTSSFNQAFNKEAIRLIREGTSWRTTQSGQTGQVVYNVEF